MTLTTITTPHTICQLPIVHQRLTQHNNPFQILAEDDDDNDDSTFVASNCSPQAPLPTQHECWVPTDTLTTAPRPPTQRMQPFQTLNQPLRPLPFMIPFPCPQTTRPRPQLIDLPQTFLIIPPVDPTAIPHNLRPFANRKWMHTPTRTASSPLYNIIEPDNECCNHPTPWLSTSPCCSNRIINMRLPGNISIQAIHHIMTLEAIKVATDLQWTGPIIDIGEHHFEVVHSITKQTITQYKKLQHDPDLKHL
jgi:hypothetical protein